ncbi:MAG: aminoacyl-tRNA hydrolase [Patescibacteria group bacterium]|mgnify:CR=1 FL=1
MKYITALGNPGEEYKNTRHNVGRIALEEFAKKNGFSDWIPDKKLKALSSQGKIGKEKTHLIEPETFMNKSGLAVKPIITSKKKAEALIVIHDDLDLPIGKFKISFNKSSGGHRGVESIIKAIKTEAFTRVRIGISPATPSGKLKKPKGEKDVGDFILGEFKKSEMETLKKISKKVADALEMIISEGREKAMGEFNRG